MREDAADQAAHLTGVAQGLVRKGSGNKRASAEEVQAGMALDLENTLGAMWLVQCGRLSSRCQREAVLAAVLFALHPVHCEAVAGVVGHAELVSAAFALVGLLAYIIAVKSRERFVLPSCQQQFDRQQDAGAATCPPQHASGCCTA